MKTVRRLELVATARQHAPFTSLMEGLRRSNLRFKNTARLPTSSLVGHVSLFEYAETRVLFKSMRMDWVDEVWEDWRWLSTMVTAGVSGRLWASVGVNGG